MSKPRQPFLRWQDLPRDRRRRLTVLIGRLIRQHLGAPRQEVDHERHRPTPGEPASREGP
jgi:hypothetical protein